MKKTISKTSWYLALFLTIMNLWMWDSQLPFSAYSENNFKMAILQLFHVILIVAELWLLMQVGRTFKRHQLGRTRVITSWLVLVAYALGALLLRLLWKNEFSFSELLNAVFPLMRNLIPLATAYLIAMLTFPRVNEYSEAHRRFIGKVLVGMFLVATVFYDDLWGIKDSQNALFYLMVMLIGATFDGIDLPSHWRKQIKRGGVGLFIVTAILAMLMPTISVTIHFDMSTASRFASLSDGLLVLVALAIFLLEGKTTTGERELLNGNAYSALLLAGLPFLVSRYVSFTAAHVSNLSLKIILVGALSVVIIFVGTVINLSLQKLFSHLPITKRYEAWVATLPHHLMEWPAWVKQFCRRHWPALTAAGVAYLLAIIGLWLTFSSLALGPSYPTSGSFSYQLLARQGTLIFTAILIWLLFKVVQSVTGKYWLSLGLTAGLMVVFFIADHIKLGLRDEPILPSDVTSVQTYGEILKFVSGGVVVAGGIGLILIICLGLFFDHKIPVSSPSWKRRLLWAVLTVCFFGSSTLWNHTNSRISTFISGLGNEPLFYSQLAGAHQNGPIIQFMNNIDITIMEQPAGYSEARMEAIAKRYQKKAAEINQNRQNNLSSQTIVFNLSESFANPKRVPGLKMKGNPIPYILSLKKATTSGLMMSSDYGGGTANIEYMTLTGLAMVNFSATMQAPYTQLVPRLTQNWTFNQLFKYAVGIHPYEGTFYSRIGNYAKFGFNRFYYLGSKYKVIHQKTVENKKAYLSDETAYANALKQLRGDKNGTFINLITMQNHLPYSTDKYDDYAKWLPIKVSAGTDRNEVAAYTTGLTYTDKAVKKFIKEINKIQKPITVVFYGDHLPGIYNNSMAKDGTKLHQTDYFIYSNTYAQKHGARTLTDHTKVVSPNDFIAMVAEQTNSKVTPYLALLTAVYQDLPAVSVNTGQGNTNATVQFTNDKGQIVKENQLTKKQKQLWQDYKLVQYDLTAGKQYLYKFKMMK